MEKDLKEVRKAIDQLDDEIARLFSKRLLALADIAEVKRKKELPIHDKNREAQIVERTTKGIDALLKDDVKTLFEAIFDISRKRQARANSSYGIIGRGLDHSFSPIVHKALENYDYELIDINEDELDDFMRKRNFAGINVTIPYKQSVVKYCDQLSITARETGIVNTIVRMSDGSFFGDNTDVFGFVRMAQSAGVFFKGKKVLILGDGATSQSVQYAVRKMGAREIVVMSRKGEIKFDMLPRHEDAEVIVNTTPVGMYPDNGKALLDVWRFRNCTGVLDVVYNPLRTALTLEAKRLGIPWATGLSMLVAQAQKSCEAFFGTKMPDEKIREITDIIASELTNIVFVGMTGCGKTELGRAAALVLNREFIDTDMLIEQRIGCKEEFIKTHGEEKFRELEREEIAEAGKRTGVVISTGDNVVLDVRNYEALKQNGKIFFIERQLDLLSIAGRPLSMDIASLRRMYDERLHAYQRFADYTVYNTENLGTTLKEILGEFYEILGD